MDAATLLLLTSSVGVGFGWQPLPDGTPRVEYLVQIEPEMLTALQAGSAIPIVGEVPEDIGPIGRIRIVIGRGSLPRQGLPEPLKTILRKPNSDAPSPNISAAPPASVQQDSTVLRGQFTPSVSAGLANTQPGYKGQEYKGPRYAQQSGTGPSSTSAPSPMPPQNTPPSAFSESPPGGSSFQKAIAAGERQAAAAQATVAQASGFSAAGVARVTGVAGTMGVAGTETSIGPTTTSGQPAASSNLYPSAGAVAEGTIGTQRLDQPLSVDATIGVRQTIADQKTREGVQDELKSHELTPGFPKSYPDQSAILTEVRGLSAGKGPSVSKNPAPKFPKKEQNSQASDRAPKVTSQIDLANNTPIGADNQSASGFMLVLAWVLLIGSVAGNFYLFWSYLDIRGKYHAMIRSNRGTRLPYSGAA